MEILLFAILLLNLSVAEKVLVTEHLPTIDKLLESDEDNFEYLYEKGNIYFKTKDMENAERFLIEALKRGHPNKFKIYL